MQQRSQFYSLQQILSADLLNAQVYSLIGDANGLQSVLGSAQTLISNIILSPTSPQSLTLNITNGFILSLQPVDASSYGSLPANTQQVLQLGYNQQTSIAIGNDLAAGQAQYVLIQAGFEQIDSNAVVLPYVNVSNPATPYNGPGNSGIAQDTIRNAVCVISLKPGTPAVSGSEVPPVCDAGNVAIAYVDLQAGQVTIASDQILDPDAVVLAESAGSPSAVLAGLLQSHHSGAVGQAPKIMLGTTGPIPQEVQGELPVANLFASNVIGGVVAARQGSGNPNGVLGGNANRNGVSDEYYDVTNNALYKCTTTGDASTAVWTSTNLPASHQLNRKVFTSSGSYIPTPGTKYMKVTACGGGGGGCGADGTIGGGHSGGAGGGADTCQAILPTAALTFPATVTVGVGGNGAGANASGGNGTNSQFSTTELGTAVTGYGAEGGYTGTGSMGSITLGAGGRGGGVLQSISPSSTITLGAVTYPIIHIFGDGGDNNINQYLSVGGVNNNNGGASFLGGGGRGGTVDGGLGVPGQPAQQGGIGAGGGSGGFDNSQPNTGANGSNGIVIIDEFVGN